VLGTLTFQFITKHTIYFETAALEANVVFMILTCLFIPESPKYLIGSRQLNEARKSLSYIAKFNGVSE